MKPFIRPALADDQSEIISLVRSERLNPIDLDWCRFIVAVHDEKVIGAVQVRRHWDGALELGSLVVAPAFRKQRIATTMIDKVLESVPKTVWMITWRAHADHYAAWGFALAEIRAAPGSVRFNYRMGRAARIISWFRGVEPANLTLLVRTAREAGGKSEPIPVPSDVERAIVGCATAHHSTALTPPPAVRLKRTLRN